MNRLAFVFFTATCVLTLVACRNEQTEATDSDNQSTEPAQEKTPAALSLSGKPFYASEPSEKLMEQLEEHKRAVKADANDADSMVWFRTIYGLFRQL